MEQDERTKYTANTAFKLLLFFLACMAGIGILQLFVVLRNNINL